MEPADSRWKENAQGHKYQETWRLVFLSVGSFSASIYFMRVVTTNLIIVYCYFKVTEIQKLRNTLKQGFLSKWGTWAANPGTLDS